MKNLFLTLFMLVGLLVSPLALAQDDAPPAADEAAEMVADEAAEDDEAAEPVEGDGGEEPAAEAEGDEGAEEPAAEGDEAAEAGEDLDVGEAVEQVGMIVEAFKSGAWPLGLGLLLTLLVAIANKFGLKDMVGAKWIPWVSMGLAVLASVGAGLVASLPWLDVVIAGVTAGVAAVGGWEMLFKHIPGLSTSKAEAEA